jgi:glucosamine--fructose-6-phosphate aminotransferase (isomerizing)
MCGIVGAVAQRDVSGILIEGLKRLEYRGYDSAGLALQTGEDEISRLRAVGKVAELADKLSAHPVKGSTGIAHTRWATHGKPSEANAHPHMSRESIALVHNGIIENYEQIRAQLKDDGYVFTSETDTEVVAHLIDQFYRKSGNLEASVKLAIRELHGAYALCVMHKNEPGRIVATREGSPLVIGVGIGEYFLASDQLALLPVTDQFIFLEEGDIAIVEQDQIRIEDKNGHTVERRITRFEHGIDAADKGQFRHYMLKEIYEQPKVVKAAMENRLSETHVLEQSLGAGATEILDQVQNIQIVACGTSYHAGMVARYWLESIAGVPCQVEVASEYRYRKHVIAPNTLFITISQSGETADTLAALKEAKAAGFLAALTICNVPGSSLVRESDLAMMTNAGPEIGVASTKAFTTQLVALLIVTIALAKRRGLSESEQTHMVRQLRSLPGVLEKLLALDPAIEKLSEKFADKHHALFLGRGTQYPVAMEGALKLKEISYIHAEAYPAGELKHGPLALVDADMPVVTVAPNNDLLEKLKSNLQEVRARGGELFVFADEQAALEPSEGVHIMKLPTIDDIIAPIAYTLPLQLLSYHVAVLKGTDVDQPRNLAKSVTVE